MVIQQSSTQEKIAVLEKTLAGMGDDEPILAGKKVLEKELDKLQRKLNGPKKTAKHIEAKQNWINRESKRLEAETARLAELQESLRVRKETLKVAYEEIKVLREDLLREGETLDKNKSCFLSVENTEEIRRLEQKELAFWRGSASKRLVGWIRDGSAEEIVGWTMEAQRLNKEVEAKKRKLQRDDRERIQERCQNGRCNGRFGRFSVVMKVQTLTLQEISVCQQHEKERKFGTVECCDRSGILESVELECGWSGRKLCRHFPVADLNAHRLGCVIVARMFPQTGWGGCWCARIVHAVRTLGRVAMSGSYCQSEMEGTIEDCRGCGKMDCGRAGWSVDFHFSPFATQRKEIGRIRSSFDADLEPGMTDCFYVGVLILGLQMTDDLNDFLTVRATHLTVTNTWMNTHTGLILHADPVLWFNSDLCGGNGKKSVQMQWVIERMACGRVGWIQNNAEIGKQAGKLLVNMLTPMTFERALLVPSWMV